MSEINCPHGIAVFSCDSAEQCRHRQVPKYKELAAEVERLNKENDDWHEASRQLREIIDAQAKTIRETGIAHAEQAGAARLALDVATKEIEALRAKLKWFEEYYKLAETVRVRHLVGMPEYSTEDVLEAIDELEKWQRTTVRPENPPPGLERRCAHCDGPEAEHGPQGHAFVPPRAAT